MRIENLAYLGLGAILALSVTGCRSPYYADKGAAVGGIAGGLAGAAMGDATHTYHFGGDILVRLPSPTVLSIDSNTQPGRVGCAA